MDGWKEVRSSPPPPTGRVLLWPIAGEAAVWEMAVYWDATSPAPQRFLVDLIADAQGVTHWCEIEPYPSLRAP